MGKTIMECTTEIVIAIWGDTNLHEQDSTYFNFFKTRLQETIETVYSTLETLEEE